MEDESVAIGKIFLPDVFWQTMMQSPLVKMNVSKSVRIARLVQEYGPADKEEFLTAMTNITRKLGGQHFQAAKEKLRAGDMAGTIDILLTYYDKAYSNSIEKRTDLLKGTIDWNGEDVVAFAKEVKTHYQ
jgi:tRNA 2-selenouridine synthase